MHLLDNDLWVMAIRRPLSYTAAENFSLTEVITSFCEECEVVVLGNFNLPTVIRSADVYMFHGVSRNDQIFVDILLLLVCCNGCRSPLLSLLAMFWTCFFYF